MATDYREEDKEIKEAYDDYEKIREEQTKSSPRNIIGNIPPRVIVIFAGLIFFLMYLTFIQKVVTQATFFWFLVAVVVIAMVLGARQETEKKTLLPEHQLKAILYTKLKEKQRISPTEIPNGDIAMLLPCKMKKIEGFPTKYTFSFKLTTSSGLEKYYTADMNPYDGYLLGFEERPAGFRGTEVSDIKFIRHREDQWADRYDKK